jgi:bacterioferritin-associated ferredoxin
MRLLEVEPDSHSAIGIDRQLAIVLDVAELLGRGVVKNEDDWRQAARKIGARLGACTNCGSCVPELHRLIAAKAPTPKSAAESAHEPA